MIVRVATEYDTEAWAAMRAELWPDGSLAEHREEVIAMLENIPNEIVSFLAFGRDERALGFAEAALRRDYVNGCDTSPVAFLEGIYVDPSARTVGVGRGLAVAVQGWARARGCIELASDALLDNRESHAFHAAIGFAETERVVYFKQAL